MKVSESFEAEQKAAELREEIGKTAELIRTADLNNREYLNYLFRTKQRLEHQLRVLTQPQVREPGGRTLPKFKDYDKH